MPICERFGSGAPEDSELAHSPAELDEVLCLPSASVRLWVGGWVGVSECVCVCVCVCE